MYPEALDCGIPADKFWDLTLQEIMDTIESYHRTKEASLRHQAGENFRLAEIIANRIGYVFSSEKDRSEDMLVMPWDLYPGLFEDESEKIKESKSDAELDNYKALRFKHAAAWNSRFEEADNGNRS